MATWLVSGWIHLMIGFGVGWIVFKRPAWVDALLARIESWLHPKTGA